MVKAERVERRLAAILAADVAGYSRLMGADEEGTLERLKALHRELVDPKIGEHHGRIVKTMGDGLLVEFPSVVEAVSCALAVQRAMAEGNAATSAERQIAFRIGVNLGDIIVEDGDIHGDGVNIAARLEGIAELGGICISEDAFRQVRGKVDAEFTDIGEQSLKNIARPMHVYRVVPERLPEAQPPAPALPDKPSIAVLPFQNISGRSRAGVFRGRDGRGDHHRAVAGALVLCHRPQQHVHLQGPCRRCEAGRARARRALCARGQRA